MDGRRGWVEGARRAMPFAVANGIVALSFGAVAHEAGLSALAAIVMSAVVFAGSAQFTTVAIVAQGGAIGAALGAAALMNSRFVPMGIAVAPSLPGGALRRAAHGQAIIDASFALSARRDGRFDVPVLLGATAIQYVAWLGGTALGTVWGDLLGNPSAIGLDAVYPAFFVALLIDEARGRLARQVACLGALVSLAVVPFAPPGVPVLVASLAALLGLAARGRT